jgi:hypothetical protein
MTVAAVNTTIAWRDVFLVLVPVLGGLAIGGIGAMVSVKNVRSQIAAARLDTGREHRRQEVADQRAAFIAYLVAVDDMAQALIGPTDLDTFIEARRAFDRAGASIELYDPPSDLADRCDELAQEWGAISRAAQGAVPIGQPVTAAALAHEFAKNVGQIQAAEEKVSDAMKSALAVLADPAATNTPP